MRYDNKYEIKNLRPICQCGCELSLKERHKNRYYSGGILLCPNCENTYLALDRDILDDFEKKIIHNINTENYPKNISE